MAVKATLKIVLMANDIEIAESNDPILWQSVFSSITQGTSVAQSAAPAINQSDQNNISKNSQSSSALINFASEIGISPEEIEGALAPTTDAPFIHLDPHCWEALKKNTPPRGPQAVSAISLAATTLAIWFKHAGIEGIPTTKQSLAVLKTIHIEEKNSARALKNAEWLQTRGNGIVINPAQRSRAIKLTSAYCTKSSI